MPIEGQKLSTDSGLTSTCKRTEVRDHPAGYVVFSSSPSAVIGFLDRINAQISSYPNSSGCCVDTSSTSGDGIRDRYMRSIFCNNLITDLVSQLSSLFSMKWFYYFIFSRQSEYPKIFGKISLQHSWIFNRTLNMKINNYFLCWERLQ